MVPGKKKKLKNIYIYIEQMDDTVNMLVWGRNFEVLGIKLDKPEKLIYANMLMGKP